eukprot:TRINITY_DN22897_c0_g1_i1.p1 TRINITY_DN22897_c0_g1~~TRINITY_DN22897_c0_g1_i1.p1  ORF type:complete len:171 (+),score=15.49 TRINITY_DN22897_c0_g1_i1:30-542(+)
MASSSSPSSRNAAGPIDFRLGNNPEMYAAHPMTPQYLRSNSLPRMDLKSVWGKRQEGNFTIPTGMSQTVKSFAASQDATEYSSSCSMHDRLRKHARSPISPTQKFNFGTATSHEVGWFVQDCPTAERMGLPRRPTYGMTQSAPTKYAHNMKATLSDKAQRLILPGHGNAV